MFVGIIHTLYLIGISVLFVAGARKLWSPHAAEAALRAQQISVPSGTGRLLGIFEIAVALVAWFVEGPLTAALVGLSYLSFALFVARAARRRTPCGCVGSSREPAGYLQAVLDLAFAVAALAVASVQPEHAREVLAGQPSKWVQFGALIGLGTVLAHHATGLLVDLSQFHRRERPS